MNFKDLISKVQDSDAIFGLYYNEQTKQLGINGGDWMEEEDYGPIDDWCEKNGLEPVYEAEVSDNYFLGKGFVQIY